MTHIMKIEEMANSKKRRIALSPYAYRKYMALPGMDENIRDWYFSEFPEERELASDMNSITFAELLKQFCKDGNCIYDAIGVDDSVVREHFFEKLSEMCNLEYDDFYYHWINS